MKSPILSLDDFGLTGLNIRWAPADAEELSSTWQIKYEVGFKVDEPKKYRLALSFINWLRTSQGADHLVVEVTIVGFFTLPEDMSLPDRERVIRLNGLTILYGALRGALLPLTASFPIGFRYVLPAVDMSQVVEDAEGRRSEGAKQPPPDFEESSERQGTAEPNAEVPSKTPRRKSSRKRMRAK